MSHNNIDLALPDIPERTHNYNEYHDGLVLMTFHEDICTSNRIYACIIVHFKTV